MRKRWDEKYWNTKQSTDKKSITLPETNIFTPNNDGFQVRNLLFQGAPIFRCEMLVSGKVNFMDTAEFLCATEIWRNPQLIPWNLPRLSSKRRRISTWKNSLRTPPGSSAWTSGIAGLSLPYGKFGIISRLWKDQRNNLWSCLKIMLINHHKWSSKYLEPVTCSWPFCDLLGIHLKRRYTGASGSV